MLLVYTNAIAKPTTLSFILFCPRLENIPRIVSDAVMRLFWACLALGYPMLLVLSFASRQFALLFGVA